MEYKGKLLSISKFTWKGNEYYSLCVYTEADDKVLYGFKVYNLKLGADQMQNVSEAFNSSDEYSISYKTNKFGYAYDIKLKKIVKA